jgi:uncharacterized metal-binding protein
MKTTPESGRTGGPDLMLACSGAADLAAIGALAVRTLRQAGAAKMFCRAGLAGGVELIAAHARAAHRMLDACDSGCARLAMRNTGFPDSVRFRISAVAWENGKSPLTSERVAEVAGHLRSLPQVEPA